MKAVFELLIPAGKETGEMTYIQVKYLLIFFITAKDVLSTVNSPRCRPSSLQRVGNLIRSTDEAN